MQNNALNTPLSDDEYDDLGALLAAPELGGRAMDVAMLEGMLTAVAIGPNLVMPQQWLPFVWDAADGATGPMFTSGADAERVAGLIMRHYNHMIQWMTDEPSSFEPIYECGPEWEATAWCQGFLTGMRLDAAAWSPLVDGEPTWFDAFNRLGTAEGRTLIAGDDDEERWMAEVTPAVIKINAFWTAQRQPAAAQGAQRPLTRETPKVGRNDPCSCGSGKKFKKCCGVNA